jgi:virginiamycin B lyase
MRGRNRVGWVLAVTIAGVVGVVAPGAAADKKGRVTEFSTGITAGTYPRAITAGPDGNVWFTEYAGGRIGRITPDGAITEFSASSSDRVRLNGITAGPDGNVWFTERDRNSARDLIGRITPAGVVTEFSAGLTPDAYLDGITAGPDGNLWFTEATARRIGRITPAGVVTEFSAGITDTISPSSIIAGPDGNLWFTEVGGQDRYTGAVSPGGIGRITPAGVITEFATGITDWPQSITAGCDGNLWFTQPNGNTIGRITPRGRITEFSVGSVAEITVGPDGNVWFTEGDLLEFGTDQVGPGGIGRITPKGKVTDFSAGITDATGGGITAGPDGNLWFTQTDHQGTGNGRIGRIGPGPSPKPRGRHHPTRPAACPRRRRNN